MNLTSDLIRSVYQGWTDSREYEYNDVFSNRALNIVNELTRLVETGIMPKSDAYREAYKFGMCGGHGKEDQKYA